jgi:hypothetical protein
MDPSIDQPPQSAAAAPLPPPPTGEERTDAYLVAASMLGDTPDAFKFSSTYSAFCRGPIPPLPQLLPPGPAVQTHVTAAPVDRSGWLHQLPGGGLSLAPVCELSSHAQPPQPAAPRDRSSAATSSAETGGPCPGVTRAEVEHGISGGRMYPSDVVRLPSWTCATSGPGPLPRCNTEPLTSAVRYATDKNGDLHTVWSVNWYERPRHARSTAARAATARAVHRAVQNRQLVCVQRRDAERLQADDV